MKPAAIPGMSTAEFNAVLDRLKLGQSEFARVLRRLGDPRQDNTVLRHVQAMANGEIRVSPAVTCLLGLMEQTDVWRTLPDEPRDARGRKEATP